MRTRAVIAVGVAVAVWLAVGSLAGASSPVVGKGGTPSGLIAFTRADGIYVMRADGRRVRPLRCGGAAVGVVALGWSPDGRRLAFSNGSEIWTMDADGSDPVRVFAGDDSRKLLGPLNWSPTGRRIAFTAFHPSASESLRNWDIWVVKADGTDARRLLRTPRIREFDVDWSPDGNRLAFSDTTGMILRLGVMNADGKNLRMISRWPQFQEAMPDWSPEGRRIAFMGWPVHNDGGNVSGSLAEAEIWVTNLGGHSRRLTTDTVLDSSPVWSPDGTKIAFVRGGRSSWAFLGPAKSSSSEIYVVNADGSGVKRLTHDRVGEGSPAWQPVAPS